jgi:hypothetical protein
MYGLVLVRVPMDKEKFFLFSDFSAWIVLLYLKLVSHIHVSVVLLVCAACPVSVPHKIKNIFGAERSLSFTVGVKNNRKEIRSQPGFGVA